MKKIVASVGLVALGVSGAYAAYPPGLSTMDTSKALSLTASLRGFYDDNYGHWPSDKARSSFGFEISPSVRVNLPLEQTYLSARYIYSGRYYEDRNSVSSNDPWDHTHQFDLILNHSFSERYSVNVQDTFVIAQEPELLAPLAGPLPVLYRVQGNNIRNTGSIGLNAELTRLLNLAVSYHNSIWDYENSHGNFLNPSLSGLLDRMEHAASMDLNWRALPETSVVFGYTFGMTEYSSTETIGLLPNLAGPGNPFGIYTSRIRDLQSHSLYAGAEHKFLPDLTGSVRLGATYLDYRHREANNNTWMPYADAQLTYVYAPDSNVRVGVKHTYNSTDFINLPAPNAATRTVTSSQHSTSAYAALTHRLTAMLSASGSVMYQHSTFAGGDFDGQNDDFLMLGINLAYAINQHWSAEVGYDYDLLSSNVPRRDYNRNRVYLGVTASY